MEREMSKTSSYDQKKSGEIKAAFSPMQRILARALDKSANFDAYVRLANFQPLYRTSVHANNNDVVNSLRMDYMSLAETAPFDANEIMNELAEAQKCFIA